MDTTLTIKAMHCAACETLVTMEIEEAGLADKVQSLTLADNNTGKLELKNVTDEDIRMVKSTINNMDSYSVD